MSAWVEAYLRVALVASGLVFAIGAWRAATGRRRRLCPVPEIEIPGWLHRGEEDFAGELERAGTEERRRAWVHFLAIDERLRERVIGQEEETPAMWIGATAELPAHLLPGIPEAPRAPTLLEILELYDRDPESAGSELDRWLGHLAPVVRVNPA